MPIALRTAEQEFTTQNKDSVAFSPGQVAATHSSGSGIIKASASDNGKNAIGLVRDGIPISGAGKVRSSGLFTLDDWTNVTGTVTLAAKATYYLSETPGELTTVPPSGAGKIVQEVGLAVEPDTLEIDIRTSIILA